MLVTEQDFYDLTTAYVRRVAAPTGRGTWRCSSTRRATCRAASPSTTVVGGMTRALREGEAEYASAGGSSCASCATGPQAEALEMLELALPTATSSPGSGSTPPSCGHPPAEFAEVYAQGAGGGLRRRRARRRGGPARLHRRRARRARRRAASTTASRPSRTAELQRRLADERVPLTMCPLSNLELQVTPDLSRAPAQAAARRRALRDGQLGRPRVLRRLPARQLPRRPSGRWASAARTSRSWRATPSARRCCPRSARRS